MNKGLYLRQEYSPKNHRRIIFEKNINDVRKVEAIEGKAREWHE